MKTKAEIFFSQLSGKDITFLGIGISHINLIKQFAMLGANITACDKRSLSDLGNLAEELTALGVKLNLGKDYLANLSDPIIFRTPGISFFIPEITQARAEGKQIVSELELFFDFCPCPIIGITGSDGKTTTTTIVSEILEAQGYKVHVGGNLGKPLLPNISQINIEDIAVVELSSFQLISMGKSPHISVITNISPNHLDIHKDMKEYVSAKRNILAHQTGLDIGVLNEDNLLSIESGNNMRGTLCTFSMKNKVKRGAWLDDEQNICITNNNQTKRVVNVREIKLPGQHNIENFLAAFTATMNYADIETMAKVAKTFGGVEHRIEFVKEKNGVKWYNDSIASSPTRTIAALSCFNNSVILIAGGYDKNIPFNTLAPHIAKNVKELIILGDTAEKIINAVTSCEDYNSQKLKITRVNTMEQAVATANTVAIVGDNVILSPACASFDMYKNFEIRGKHFKELVNKL